MRFNRLLGAVAACAMATAAFGAAPALAEPDPDVSIMTTWDCSGKRVPPESKAASLGCLRGGPYNPNSYSRGIWDCDSQRDIWTDTRYYSWAMTKTCQYVLNGWDFEIV